MGQTWIRLYGELNDFVPAGWRQRPVLRRWDVSPSVKDLIEGQGVPHPEIDLLLANGHSVGFDCSVHDGDRISVYPPFRTVNISDISHVRPDPLPEMRFVADGHLERLVGYLQMLGFDTAYRNDDDDETLAQISHDEQRVLLTRDRQLLMRNVVRHGYWVRSTQPSVQLVEVARRYGLAEAMRPFTRFLRCNALLEPVDKASIEHLLEPATCRHYDRFWRCPGCQRIYWLGSHHQRMSALIRELREQLGGDEPRIPPGEPDSAP